MNIIDPARESHADSDPSADALPTSPARTSPARVRTAAAETPAELVAVFGASTTPEGSDAWNDAFTLGAALARRGYGVVTGGYAGTMEAVSAGAASAERAVPIVGVTVPEVFRDRPHGNRWLTAEHRAPTLLSRMERMLSDAVAAVALPGSIGTFTEVMVAWNLAFVGRFSGVEPRPLITVGDAWRRLCAHVGEHTETDTGLVICVATVEDVPLVLDDLLPSAHGPGRAGS